MRGHSGERLALRGARRRLPSVQQYSIEANAPTRRLSRGFCRNTNRSLPKMTHATRSCRGLAGAYLDEHAVEYAAEERVTIDAAALGLGREETQKAIDRGLSTASSRQERLALRLKRDSRAEFFERRRVSGVAGRIESAQNTVAQKKRVLIVSGDDGNTRETLDILSSLTTGRLACGLISLAPPALRNARALAGLGAEHSVLKARIAPLPASDCIVCSSETPPRLSLERERERDSRERDSRKETRGAPLERPSRNHAQARGMLRALRCVLAYAAADSAETFCLPAVRAVGRAAQGPEEAAAGCAGYATRWYVTRDPAAFMRGTEAVASHRRRLCLRALEALACLATRRLVQFDGECVSREFTRVSRRERVGGGSLSLSLSRGVSRTRTRTRYTYAGALRNAPF